jgi:nitrite reductase/ring-hydroxylating ferredoxin subunit
MKKSLILVLVFCTFLNCEKDTIVNNNPNIPNYPFSIIINQNLPSYSGLKSSINPIYIGEANVGFRGIYVIKISDTEYKAWEASCPNQNPNNCTTPLKLEGNTNLKCICNDEVFSLFTGQGKEKYPLKPYRVEILDPVTIRVFN